MFGLRDDRAINFSLQNRVMAIILQSVLKKRYNCLFVNDEENQYCFFYPRFISIFEKFHKPIPVENQVQITLVQAQLVEILCTLAAYHWSYTIWFCIHDALVFEYGTIVVYCIKLRKKCPVNPIG